MEKKRFPTHVYLTLFHPYNEWNMLLKFGQLFLKHPVYRLKKIVSCFWCKTSEENCRIRKSNNVEDTLTRNLQDCRSRWHLHRLVVDEELDQFLLRLAGRRVKTDGAVPSTCQACGPHDR